MYDPFPGRSASPISQSQPTRKAADTGPTPQRHRGQRAPASGPSRLLQALSCAQMSTGIVTGIGYGHRLPSSAGLDQDPV